MIKVENIEAFNFEGALRGMRMPFMSHSKSDSHLSFSGCTECDVCEYIPNIGVENKCHDCDKGTGFVIGKNDMELCKKLIKGGSPHRKFLRQIFISMDITAPLYFWKQFSTYKVGTTANSTSTMHCIHKRDLTIDDFSHDKLIAPAVNTLKQLIDDINELRTMYVNYDEFVKSCTCNGDVIPSKKDLWYSIIQLLPSSFNQTRTVTMSYENALNIIHWRSAHKLEEWRTFCDVLINELPYMKDFIGEEMNTK